MILRAIIHIRLIEHMFLEVRCHHIIIFRSVCIFGSQIPYIPNVGQTLNTILRTSTTFSRFPSGPSGYCKLAKFRTIEDISSNPHTKKHIAIAVRCRTAVYRVAAAEGIQKTQKKQWQW